MSTLGKRVRQIIVYHGTTTTGFAKTLNISQSMVSKICTEKSTPSERTIADICRIYHVKKEWLLHGNGEMLDSGALEKELEEVFHVGNNSVDDEYKRRIIRAMAEIPPVGWSFLADYADYLARECQEHPNCVRSVADAYKEGVRTGIKLVDLTGDQLRNFHDDKEE